MQHGNRPKGIPARRSAVAGAPVAAFSVRVLVGRWTPLGCVGSGERLDVGQAVCIGQRVAARHDRIHG
jgi:hypothetical protein